jgi:hypothetical protein
MDVGLVKVWKSRGDENEKLEFSQNNQLPLQFSPIDNLK